MHVLEQTYENRIVVLDTSYRRVHVQYRATMRKVTATMCKSACLVLIRIRLVRVKYGAVALGAFVFLYIRFCSTHYHYCMLYEVTMGHTHLSVDKEIA